MNRERNLCGSNGYDRELRFNPIEYLRNLAEPDCGRSEPLRWLDLCCGTGTALVEAAGIASAEHLLLEIVGVDLVDMFQQHKFPRLKFVVASLAEWQPDGQFDLVTCIHGLHYIGDKLGLICRCANWLKDGGRFVANIDMANIVYDGRPSNRIVTRELRKSGFEYTSRTRLLQFTADQKPEPQLPFHYLGADDQSGPNYTGQPAVNSHYWSGDDGET